MDALPEPWERIVEALITDIANVERPTPHQVDVQRALRACLCRAQRRELSAQANVLLNLRVGELCDALSRAVKVLWVAAAELRRAGLAESAALVERAAREARRAVWGVCAVGGL